MDEVHVFADDSQKGQRSEARAGVWRALRDGRALGANDVAKARGLVVRERENSIFSDAWLPLAFLFLIIGFVAGRSAAIIALGVALLVIVGLSSWWKRMSLAGVTYERSYDRTHVFPDEKIVMTLTINNKKPLPLTWLQFTDELPVAPEEHGDFAVKVSEVTGTYQLQNTLSMNGYERTRRTVSLRIPRRGFYQIGPVRYQSGDIFTLFTVERQHRYIDHLVVYPQVLSLETLQLPAREMFGDLKVRRSLFTDPVKTRGIRDYQPQDRFRDVHWKATAKRGDLQTKVYDPASGMTVVAFLNVATFARHWMGFDRDLLERAISVTASVASYAAEQRWGVGVYANGSFPGSDQPIRVAPGRSPDQLVHILEALAAVTEFATGSIELLMHRESRRLPWAATLVLVTCVITEEIAIGLIRLKEAGRRVALISLAGDSSQLNLEGIRCYSVPADIAAFHNEELEPSPETVSLVDMTRIERAQPTRDKATFQNE
jgi:uncharacterized protein (DUF58 family)